MTVSTIRHVFPCPSVSPPPVPTSHHSQSLIHLCSLQFILHFSRILYKTNHTVPCSFSLPYFSRWHLFSDPAVTSIILKHSGQEHPPLVQHTSLYLLLQAPFLPLHSPLQTLSTNKSRINHFSQSLLPKRGTLPTTSLLVTPSPTVWILHTDHYYYRQHKKDKCFLLLTSSKQNQDE